MSYCQQGNLPNSADGWATSSIGDTPPGVAVVTAPDDWATSSVGDTPPGGAVVTAPDDWPTSLGETSLDISVLFPSSEKINQKRFR